MAQTIAIPEVAQAQPPIRACIFDMDGLLLNTEDIYLKTANLILARYNRPPMPWSFKASLMGVPNSSNGPQFHAWAKLPITPAQYAAEQKAEHQKAFPECELLPGVKELLEGLRNAKNVNGQEVHVALASSTSRRNYDWKTSRKEVEEVFEVFDPSCVILGDDPRLPKGVGKPSPDIFLQALACINSSLSTSEEPIKPEECLVFEDSVPGVEAGRRAEMNVLWVPHIEVAKVFAGREDEVLAGMTGLVPLNDGWTGGKESAKWTSQVRSLQDFDGSRWGIELGGAARV